MCVHSNYLFEGEPLAWEGQRFFYNVKIIKCNNDSTWTLLSTGSFGGIIGNMYICGVKLNVFVLWLICM